MVNTGNVGVSWGGVFENRLQPKGFGSGYFLSCLDALEINENISQNNIKFWATIIFWAKIILFLMCFYQITMILFYCHLVIHFTFHINCLNITTCCLL